TSPRRDLSDDGDGAPALRRGGGNRLSGTPRRGGVGRDRGAEPVLFQRARAATLLRRAQGASAGAQTGNAPGLGNRLAPRPGRNPQWHSQSRARPREPGENLSPGRLERTARGGVTRAARGSGASAVRAGLHEHRLRALYARRGARRERARGTLVVGRGCQEGMWNSLCPRWFGGARSRQKRKRMMHKGFTLWFTGMSGAG